MKGGNDMEKYLSRGTPTPEEMSLIREQGASEDVAADALYVFDVDLCDDRVDRQYERFTPDTLRELAPLFVGRSGIFDHDWSARGQTARLFRTEVVEDGDRTVLRGRAYMLRSGCQQLVRQIEAGIMREVSVGVAVKSRRCSVCGSEGGCSHRPGETYGGKLCVRELIGGADAYEWSFVAVPAQRDAGVNLSRYRTQQPHDKNSSYKISAK